ncbi:Asp23/Gls24 family envelope stress response protein [Nocardia acidivorans]|uniref:Asp23/Gls24 family envelope stress response protein n=1 Tax=Nocardia acidivorans TaxID=404580 RepID=UPI00082A8D06|nr:Asp23/Gls24 family envelope stress response protein [Nocardia acidivorans]
MAVIDTDTEQEYVLPCGRGLDSVWDRLDTVRNGGGDAHEASCIHCRTARESLLGLRTATRELIDQPDPPPSDLVERIMSAVRSELRRGQALGLPTPHAGTVAVSEQAVAVVLRYAADSVPGVRARRCRMQAVGTGPDGETVVHISMTIAVEVNGDGVHGLVPKVREAVTAAASARTGLVVGRLDIAIVDVYQEGGR